MVGLNFLSVLSFLRMWETYGGFRRPHSIERSGEASWSEVRRWLQNGAVEVNGKRPKPNDPLEWPVWSLVFFPGSKVRRTTVWYDATNLPTDTTRVAYLAPIHSEDNKSVQ